MIMFFVYYLKNKKKVVLARGCIAGSLPPCPVEEGLPLQGKSADQCG